MSLTAGAGAGAAIGSIIPGIGTSVGGAVGSIIGGGISLFGGSATRSEKRRRRNAALSTLYSLGMRQNITLGNSDNFDVVEYLASVAQNNAPRVIEGINNFFPTGGSLQSSQSEQFKALVSSINASIARAPGMAGSGSMGGAPSGTDTGFNFKAIAAVAAAAVGAFYLFK